MMQEHRQKEASWCPISHYLKHRPQAALDYNEKSHRHREKGDGRKKGEGKTKEGKGRVLVRNQDTE